MELGGDLFMFCVYGMTFDAFHGHSFEKKCFETSLICIHVGSVTVYVPEASYPPPTIRVRAFLDFPPLSKSWSTWSNLEANFPDCDVHCVYC